MVLKDPRNEGYTVVSKTEFASMEDMKYYDDSCAAHEKLRVAARTLPGMAGPPMTVFFEGSQATVFAL